MKCLAASRRSIALGSAKSNIGHLKAGAGAAGLLKAVWPCTTKCCRPRSTPKNPTPTLLLSRTPFYLTRPGTGSQQRRAAPLWRQRLRLWRHQLPHRLRRTRPRPGALAAQRKQYASAAIPQPGAAVESNGATLPPARTAPVRGIFALGAASRRCRCKSNWTPRWSGCGRVGPPDGGAAGNGRYPGPRTPHHRLRRPRRTARPAAKSAQSHELRQSASLESDAGPGHLPRRRPAQRQNRLPLPRPGQPIRQHGARTGRTLPHRRPRLRRSRRRDDPHPRQTAHRLHLRQFRRSQRGDGRQLRPDADGNLPARHAHPGHGDDRPCWPTTASSPMW
jgi:hypothetical protein